MGRAGIGEFEELVLMAVAVLQEEAYGLPVRDLLKTEVARSVSLGAVHATLYRLEDKGLVKSEMTGATASRGGRRKRVFVLTGTGTAAIRAAREARDRLLSLAPPSLKPSLAG
jgi:PadR family transcriptional regulator